MSRLLKLLAVILWVITSNASVADEESRQFVKLPEMMQRHMMSNMRDHLETINQILVNLENGQLDQAAEISESRLGMTSLKLHDASHMAKFMPQAMQTAGTNMHRAASRFALAAEEGDVLQAYRALSKVTSACVVCHSGYRIR